MIFKESYFIAKDAAEGSVQLKDRIIEVIHLVAGDQILICRIFLAEIAEFAERNTSAYSTLSARDNYKIGREPLKK